jgi:hypothetical protein
MGLWGISLGLSGPTPRAYKCCHIAPKDMDLVQKGGWSPDIKSEYFFEGKKGELILGKK